MSIQTLQSPLLISDARLPSVPSTLEERNALLEKANYKIPALEKIAVNRMNLIFIGSLCCCPCMGVAQTINFLAMICWSNANRCPNQEMMRSQSFLCCDYFLPQENRWKLYLRVLDPFWFSDLYVKKLTDYLAPPEREEMEEARNVKKDLGDFRIPHAYEIRDAIPVQGIRDLIIEYANSPERGR